MKSVIIFKHQYKPLTTIEAIESRPPSFMPAPKTIEVKAGTRDEKIRDWLFNRFNNGDEIRMEIQTMKNVKIVIKNAHIIKIRPSISPNDDKLTLTTVTIVSQNFVYTLGLIITKVWSVS